MGAPMGSWRFGQRVLSWSRELPCAWRALHVSAVCAKNRASWVQVSQGDKPVIYEEAHAPHHIAHRKGWLSLHTGNPLFISSYHLVQEGLDFVPSKQRCAYDDLIIQIFLT
ncbi:small ribosomal subunit protein uS3m-like isoform X2 [Saccopteryx bilineata]|uniref:small ribosomal subunit protein uS3m-like isoform X2 n=1 Tax=Saccopteryx bilineata TaxID=59482 RepID=UPI00338E504E